MDDLEIPKIDGRLDLRNIDTPSPLVVAHSLSVASHGASSGNILRIQGVKWRNMDFSGAHLGGMRFHGVEIQNCRFDSAACQGWRMWTTAISCSTFRGADLRGSALGGVPTNDDRCNRFVKVDFSKADLRQTSYACAQFESCRFAESNLKGIDFGSSGFTDCVFEGKLVDVQFYRQTNRAERCPENRMENIDFRKAEFHDVEFRGLDMDCVQWPIDGEHIVLSDYKQDLQRVLNGITGRTDLTSRKLVTTIKCQLEWAGPNQSTGVVSKFDLRACGPTAVEDFIRLLAAN